MLIRNPLRSPVMRAICSAFNVIDGLTPAPPSSGYGATADAGEVDDATAITGTRYWWNFGTGADANTPPTNPLLPAQTLARLYDWCTSGGGYNAASGAGFMLARGQSAVGFLQANANGFVGNFLFGATGSGTRPEILFANNPALNNPNNAGAFFNNPGTRLRNLKLNMQNSFTAVATLVTGTFVDGDVVNNGSGATGIFHYNASGVYTIQCTSFPTTFSAGNVITDTATGTKQATINSISGLTAISVKDSDQSFVNLEVANALGIGLLLSSAGGVYGDNSIIDNCTVHDACLTQANGAGIDGGGDSTSAVVVNNLTITDNTVYDCGNGGTSHNIYLNDFTNSVISGNWCYMTTNRGNHSLVIHGNCNTVLIERNMFEGANNGIGINPAYAKAETLTNFTVRRNIVRRHGLLMGQAQGYAALLAGITNSAIYNNLWYGNCFGFNLTLGGGSDSSTSNVTISHETFYNNTTGVKPTGNEAQVYIVGAVTGVVLQNSIIVNTGTSHYLLWVDTAALAGLTLRNCLLYSPNYSGNVIHWGALDYTLSAWMTAFGNALGCVVGDPLFMDATNDDFRLQSGSPAKLAGYNSGITTDFDGNARHATTPSIGAYE